MKERHHVWVPNGLVIYRSGDLHPRFAIRGGEPIRNSVFLSENRQASSKSPEAFALA